MFLRPCLPAAGGDDFKVIFLADPELARPLRRLPFILEEIARVPFKAGRPLPLARETVVRALDPRDGAVDRADLTVVARFARADGFFTLVFATINLRSSPNLQLLYNLSAKPFRAEKIGNYNNKL